AMVFLLLGLIFCAGAKAEGETPAIDLELGEEINETCAGCHGEYGQGSIDGEYPRLAGLTAEYIARQLRLFKQRKRINLPMLPYTNERELPEEDLVSIAAYLASIQLPTKLPPINEAQFDALKRLQASKKVVNIAAYPGDVEAGRKFYKKECASCHGRDGYGDDKQHIPQLAGQYSLYLFRQVENIRRDERFHDDPDDAGIFREYADAEIAAMLAYLATLDDG
ncbi:MAG: c-type cytochrome, partial [Pseudomonadota bacterium]|nr:c-type cytochrome [Pseudomonadota bacterium]